MLTVLLGVHPNNYVDYKTKLFRNIHVYKNICVWKINHVIIILLSCMKNWDKSAKLRTDLHPV